MESLQRFKEFNLTEGIGLYLDRRLKWNPYKRLKDINLTEGILYKRYLPTTYYLIRESYLTDSCFKGAATCAPISDSQADASQNGIALGPILWTIYTADFIHPITNIAGWHHDYVL